MAISSKKTGKEQIVEKLLIENYEQYYRLAYSYVHNEADALDIVQEGAEPVDEKSAADLEFTELRDAMERLEPSEKNILELRYFDGMKIEEMAGVLEINVNTAKSRLYRAIEKLRRSMTG